MQKFQASCKLMLFGEYIILRGSKSLAFPLRFGQKLEVSSALEISWKSVSPDGIWFEAKFDDNLEITSTSNQEVAQILRSIFLKSR